MTGIRQQAHWAVVVATVAALAAGCDGPGRTSETVGQKLDRSADKVASATRDAASTAADAAADAAMSARAKAALFAEPGLKAMQIDVETQNAVVTLQGSVDSDKLRQRAVEIVASLDGVRHVVDNLAVKT